MVAVAPPTRPARHIRTLKTRHLNQSANSLNHFSATHKLTLGQASALRAPGRLRAPSRDQHAYRIHLRRPRLRILRRPQQRLQDLPRMPVVQDVRRLHLQQPLELHLPQSDGLQSSVAHLLAPRGRHSLRGLRVRTPSLNSFRFRSRCWRQFVTPFLLYLIRNH